MLERTSVLRRKTAGKTVGWQMIAANVDHVIIVQSCHVDFNMNRLERYLVMASEGGASPIILLTKTDLVLPAVLEAQRSAIRAAGIEAPILTLSNVTKQGLVELVQMLQPGRTYCFVGSSGVGKSTLINLLTGRERQETGTVSGTGEGRHTTVRRELIELEGGAFVIDNPGMREFGVMDAADGIAESFTDISALSAGCRYRDCTHSGEPGCAVLDAISSGTIGREHFDNFLKLARESEFNDMSYAEKRRKDRDFSKHKRMVGKHDKRG